MSTRWFAFQANDRSYSSRLKSRNSSSRLRRGIEPLELPAVAEVQRVPRRGAVLQVHGGALGLLEVVVIEPLPAGAPAVGDLPVGARHQGRAGPGRPVPALEVPRPVGNRAGIAVHVDGAILEVVGLAEAHGEPLAPALVLEEPRIDAQGEAIEVADPVAAREAVGRPELAPGES